MIYKAQLKTRLRSWTREGERDEISQTVQAMIAVHDDGSWSLRYHEKDNGGQTSLVGCREWMTLQREGSVRSRMRFVVDQLQKALYITPFGEFDVATRAELYTFTVNDHAGRLSLHYDLLISDELAARNKLEIEWHKV